jgi:DNA-binding IclR family transcriptional regulator
VPSLTADPPRTLTEQEKSILGLMYIEEQPIDRMAVAMGLEKTELREIVLGLVEEGFVRRFQKTDKPYFGTTMLGKEAAI